MKQRDIQKPNFNGMCFVHYYTKDELDPHIVALEMEKLNVKSVRIWSHFSWIMNRDFTLKPEIADSYHTLYRELLSHGVTEIVAMSHYWFMPETKYGDHECGMCYDRDLTPGSLYLQFLDLFEESWERLVAEFPEVTAWEIGNELNHKAFMKRIDGSDFSWEDRIDIATDMMARGCRAIRKMNPKAIVIMPGMAPVNGQSEGVLMNCIAAEYDGINDSIARVYENIASGAFGSTDPRDYFGALAWHPYYAKQREDGSWYFCIPDDEWIELNRSIYQVAADHGDDGVKCYLTEYGYNDWGLETEDEALVAFTRKGFSMLRDDMDFVTTVHAYRFCDSMGYVSDQPDTYAFYHLENGRLYAKRRAYELQRQYGGHGELAK